MLSFDHKPINLKTTILEYILQLQSRKYRKPKNREGKNLLPKSSKVQHVIVELKARVNDLVTVRNKLVNYGAEQIGVFRQIDTYYKVPRGRLKLREVEGKTDAELIYYDRENVAESKRSSVFILTIPQPQVFRQILERIINVKTVVTKVREIYFYHGIQVHLDKVEDLGSFIEFERITSEDSEKQQRDLLKLKRLREKLNISSKCLERLSYSDLI